jgi:hypothetical protein
MSRSRGTGHEQVRVEEDSVLVARGGIEPPTYRFSGGRSYQLSYLAVLPISGAGEFSPDAPM